MRLSVCIPVYRVERYVAQCAQSLFAGARADDEFIFVDDCTPDASMERIREVLSGFPGLEERVRFIRHETNKGLAAARRTALSVAHGQWIAHCDADDWTDAGYYECLADEAERQGADMAYGDWCRERANGPLPRESLPDFSSGREMLMALCPNALFNSMCNKVWRREVALDAAIEWDPTISLGEDLVYSAQAISRCRRVVHVGGPCYRYRENGSSICTAEAGARRVASLCRVCEILTKRLTDARYAPMLDRLVRDILLAAIKYGAMSPSEYGSWRRRLSSPLLSDARHGFGKKGILALAELSYPLACELGGLFR